GGGGPGAVRGGLPDGDEPDAPVPRTRDHPAAFGTAAVADPSPPVRRRRRAGLPQTPSPKPPERPHGSARGERVQGPHPAGSRRARRNIVTRPARTQVPSALLGALGGLAAFGVVALIGLLIWIFVIEPTHAKASGVAEADLSLHVSATPARVQAGGPITYVFTVRNGGPDTATDVTLSDPLPVGTSIRSSNTTSGSCAGKTSVSCQLGDLKKGGSVEVRLVVTAPRRGTVSNAAQVSSATDDPDTSNDPATAATQVQAAAASADLKVSGTAKPQQG